MAKRFKKVLVLAVIFTMTLVNYGLPLQAIASEGGSFLNAFSFFKKNEIALNAYFDEDSTEKVLDVNDTATLTLEVSPLIEGYLKSGNLKFNMKNGNENNFKIQSVTIEEKEEYELDSVDELLLQETNKAAEIEESENLTDKEEVVETEVEESEEPAEENIVESEEVEELPEESENEVQQESDDEENTIANLLKSAVTTTLTDSKAIEEDTEIAENEVLSEEVVEEEEADETAEDVVAEEDDDIEEPASENMNPEDVAIEEEVIEEEAEEEVIKPCYEVSLASENEIQLKNIIDSTKIFVEIEYKQSEQINAVDLYNDIEIILEGNYINKNLETLEITRNEDITLGWEYSKEVEITSEFAKVSPFTVGENFGTIVENIITVNRNVEDVNSLPIKETNIKIEIPKINDKLPIAVNVSANKLMATLGKELEGDEFSQDNWSFDKETGILEIRVSNDNMLVGKGEDKFDIICRYEDYVEESSIVLNKNVSVQVEEYSSNKNKVQEKFIEEDEEKVVTAGELMSYSAVETEEKINKGKVNANYYIDAAYETEFSSLVNVTVLTSDILEEIKIEPVKEAYKLHDGNELDAINDVMYKGVKFNYAEVKEMLEKGSTIDLLDENDVVFHTISKENPICSIVFSETINNVKVRINKVQVNGNLTIEFVKSIVKSQYSPAEFVQVASVESTLKANVKYVGFEDVFQLPEIITENEFTDTVTNVNFTMNKTHLSTIAENENVEFKIDLINNLETSDLYKNPTFEMVFPTYVKEVKINDIYALYQNGLEIVNYFVFEENGVLKLRIELAGTQAGFNFSNITNGTNIILNANIVIEEITPQKQDEISLYYYNEAVTNYQSQANWSISKEIPGGMIKDTNGYDAVIFEYQTPTGLVAINSITNFDGTGRTIKSIKQGEKIETIAIKGESHIATMELSVLNNTGNQCLDTVLLGRIPFEGNKDVVTNQDLGTNVDTIMRSAIVPDGLNSNSATIYYSPNPNADKDLSKEGNAWGTGYADFETIRSFLIVVDGTVEPGAILKYKYDFEIPANLGYEVNMIGSFGAFYNEVTDTLVKYETSVADKVGLITEAGAKYEATMSVDIGEGAEIGEARFLKYTVKVENTGSVDFEKVTIKNERPKYGEFWVKAENDRYSDAGYVDSGKSKMVYELGALKAGETIEQEIVVKTTTKPNTLVDYASQLEGVAYESETDSYYILDENNEKVYITEMPEEIFIENFATVYIDDTVNGVTTNTIKNKLVDSNFDIETAVAIDKNPIASGDEMEYRILISNISGNELTNVVVEDVLPKELKLTLLDGFIKDENSDERSYEYDEETNTLRMRINKLEKDENTNFTIICGISNMKNIGNATLENFVTITADEDIKEQGSVAKTVVVGPELTVTQETNLQDNNVLESDEFDIVVNVNNRGDGESKAIQFNVDVPKELTITKITSEGKRAIANTITDNRIEGSLYLLGEHDIASLVISVKANPLNEGESNRVVDVNTTVSEEYIGNLEINPLSITIMDNPDRELTEEEKKEEEEASTIVNPTIPDNIDPELDNPVDTETPVNVESTDTPNNTETTENEQPAEEETITTPVENIETYKVSGQVWEDDNKNNVKDSTEDGISKVQVTLYEGDIKIKSSTTDSLGKYRFTEVPAGNYTVVFNYDGEAYAAAKYRAVNVADNQNSDAIESDEGVAVTDTINITNADVEIDLGLQDRDEFDMTVHKYIVKSIVNKKGKETVETYDDKELAKLEIKSKELKNTTIKLEYKIVITNEGSVNGTVGMVNDYLPEALIFNESENTGWQQGTDRVLYNETLKDVVIKPGESKELRLVLSKVMTEDNTGTISNKVELNNLSTDKALEENEENNIATQEMIITVSTGRTISIVVMITLLILCSVVIYGIKTGKIKRTYK